MPRGVWVRVPLPVPPKRASCRETRGPFRNDVCVICAWRHVGKRRGGGQSRPPLRRVCRYCVPFSPGWRWLGGRLGRSRAPPLRIKSLPVCNQRTLSQTRHRERHAGSSRPTEVCARGAGRFSGLVAADTLHPPQAALCPHAPHPSAAPTPSPRGEGGTVVSDVCVVCAFGT